jgi:hypothetical protein
MAMGMALLAFDRDGAPLGVFVNDERIADPRGLIAHQQEGLLDPNSGKHSRDFPRLHGQALVFFPSQKAIAALTKTDQSSHSEQE